MSQSRLQRALMAVSLTALRSDVPVPSERLLRVTTSHSSRSTLNVTSPTTFSSATAAKPSSSLGSNTLPLLTTRVDPHWSCMKLVTIGLSSLVNGLRLTSLKADSSRPAGSYAESIRRFSESLLGPRVIQRLLDHAVWSV